MDLRRHLEDDVLAWWLTHGPDAARGGVRTCWDNRGQRLVSEDRYTWSQGRWAWLGARVATAARRGVLDADADAWATTSVATARFVADHAFLPDGTTAYLMDADGRPREVGGRLHASIYADLFAALGFAGAATVDDGRDWLGLGTGLLTAAATRYRAHDYASEPYPVSPGRGTHALPMMLLGVGEQLVRAGAGERALAVVRDAADDLDRHYWLDVDAAEVPRLDGAPDDTVLGRHRCPGHLLEALWFAEHAAYLLPGHPLTDPGRLTHLALRACEAAWDDEHGGLLRFVDRDGGRPRGIPSGDGYEDLVTRTWDTKLWWIHAEAMYALTLLAARTGDPELARWRDEVVGWTMTTFPAGTGQEWIQNRRRDGSPLDEVVALPVKDPLHVARALLLLRELDASTPPEKENR